MHNPDINIDVYSIIELPGPLEDYGQFTFSSNIAYLQMKPWVVSIFSFTLLLPKVSQLTLRIIPNACPYGNYLVEDTQLHGELWIWVYELFEPNVGNVLVWQESHEKEHIWWNF